MCIVVSGKEETRDRYVARCIIGEREVSGEMYQEKRRLERVLCPEMYRWRERYVGK